MPELSAKKLYGLILGLATVIMVSVGCRGFASSHDYRGTHLDPAWPLPDFELTDANGQPFRLSDAEGKLVLIYFGYTHCPDVCPLTLLDIKEALKGLESAERVQVIFISLDPERDTPERLNRYLRAFDPGFIGLTGADSQAIQEVIKTYRVEVEKEETSQPAAGSLVDHTARLYLINPRRELFLTYAFGFDPADLRHDLKQLLHTMED
jgi:protein SCO1/2